VKSPAAIKRIATHVVKLPGAVTQINDVTANRGGVFYLSLVFAFTKGLAGLRAARVAMAEAEIR
jgi:hypothetical protein